MSIFEAFRRKPEEPENMENERISLQTQHVCEILDLREDELEEVLTRDFLKTTDSEEQNERLKEKGYIPETIIEEGRNIAESLKPDMSATDGLRLPAATMNLAKKYKELKTKHGDQNEIHLRLGLMANVATQAYRMVKACQPDTTLEELEEIKNKSSVLNSGDEEHRDRVNQFVEERNNNSSALIEKEKDFIRTIADQNEWKQYNYVAQMLNRESKIGKNE